VTVGTGNSRSKNIRMSENRAGAEKEERAGMEKKMTMEIK
jgi:hypothetical protein